MAVRHSVLALVLVLALAGCGTVRSRPRTELATYLNRVAAVERQLVTPLRTVTVVGAQFSADPRRSAAVGGLATRVREAQLLSAWRSIRSLGRRLASIPAPATANSLRALLLRVVDGQAALTRQTARLVVFLPSFAAALRPLQPATARLERVLSVNRALGPAAVQAVYSQKVTALRQFKATLTGIAARLRRLDPPPVSAPSYRAQLTALDGMAANAGRLASALQSGDRARIPRLLRDFDRAAVTPQTRGVQEAEVSAAKAYDAQTGRLRDLAAQAQQKRAELANRLQ